MKKMNKKGFAVIEILFLITWGYLASHIIHQKMREEREGMEKERIEACECESVCVGDCEENETEEEIKCQRER